MASWLDILNSQGGTGILGNSYFDPMSGFEMQPPPRPRPSFPEPPRMPPGMMQGGQNYLGSDPFNFMMPGQQAPGSQPMLPPLPPPQEISGQPQFMQMPVSMPVTPDQAAANPGVAPPGSTPGFGDVLNRNALTLMALGGGIAQGGIGRGFSEAAKVGALEQAQNQPKLTETGTDPLTGQKTFAWAFPNQAKLVPASSTGNAMGASGNTITNDVLQKIAGARENGMPPAEALKLVPAGYRDYVDSLLQGKAIPTNLGRPGPARGALIALAHAVDPNFDETQIPLRIQFAKGMGSTTSSSYGGQVLKSGTVVKHLGDAYDSLSELEKGALGPTDTLSALNPLKSAVRGQAGDPAYRDALGKWEIAKKGIAGELEQLLSGSHGAEASKQFWMDKLDFNKGPAYVRGVLDEVRSLMMGRLSNVAQAKDRAYGGETDPFSLLGPKEQKIAIRIQNSTYAAKPESQQQSAPDSGWTVRRIGQ